MWGTPGCCLRWRDCRGCCLFRCCAFNTTYRLLLFSPATATTSSANSSQLSLRCLLVVVEERATPCLSSTLPPPAAGLPSSGSLLQRGAASPGQRHLMLRSAGGFMVRGYEKKMAKMRESKLVAGFTLTVRHERILAQGPADIHGNPWNGP